LEVLDTVKKIADLIERESLANLVIVIYCEEEMTTIPAKNPELIWERED
jgi:hypothetical protein